MVGWLAGLAAGAKAPTLVVVLITKTRIADTLAETVELIAV